MALTAFILLIVLSGLFVALNVGELSSTISSARVDLQARVRQILGWIVKDVRQTSLVEITNSNPAPSPDYIKFRRVTGINDATGQFTYSTNYVEYSYNGSGLTRSEISPSGTVLKSWSFDNITESPFYADSGIPLDQANLTVSRKMVVIITGTSQPRSDMALNYTLSEEVKIRNE